MMGLKIHLRVLIYYFFSSISLLADSVFIYFVGMLLLERENGGVLCALILGIDESFEVLLGPFLARYIDRVSDFGCRLRTSFRLQIFLAILTFLLALANPSRLVSVIVFLALIRLLSLIDTQLKAALPLHLEKRGRVPLMQSLSFTVFSKRCILLMSSSIALYFLGFPWFFTCSLNSLSYLLAIVGLLVMMRFFKFNDQKTASLVERSQINDDERSVNSDIDRFPIVQSRDSPTPKFNSSSYLSTHDEQKRWIRWNYRIVFFSGIAFGAVPLILTKSMLVATADPFFLKILQGPAPIYVGVFVSLLLMMIYPHKISAFASNGRCVCIISILIGLSLILTSVAPPIWRPVVLFFLGIINGIGLVGLDAFFQRKIEGPNFVKVVAKNQAFSKGGVLISLWLAGICIDRHFTSSNLLLISGTCAITFFSPLFLETFFIDGIKKPLIDRQKGSR